MRFFFSSVAMPDHTIASYSIATDYGINVAIQELTIHLYSTHTLSNKQLYYYIIGQCRQSFIIVACNQ